MRPAIGDTVTVHYPASSCDDSRPVVAVEKYGFWVDVWGKGSAVEFNFSGHMVVKDGIGHWSNPFIVKEL